MWDKINKVRAALALAVIGTLVITVFIMVLIALAAHEKRWDFVDKWTTLLFNSLVCNAFLGYLFVKSQTSTAKNEIG